MNKKIIALLLVAAMALSLIACGNTAANNETQAENVAMQYITADEAKELLENDEYVFFDIRKAADSSANSIPGALAYDMDAAKEGDAEAGKATMTEATKGLDKKIILVCYSGKRYAQAATNALSAIGYDMTKVYTLEGGFTNWSEKLPELTTAGGAVEAPEASTVRTDLVLYESADIDSLDPMETKTGAGTKLAGLQYEGLIKYMYEHTADGATVNTAKPCLAESWEYDAENMTVTFYLKKGVKFHNGDEFTAEDVLFSFERALNSSTKLALMAGYESAEAIDEYTVVMKLNALSSAFQYNISQIPMMNKSFVEEHGEEFTLETVCGTGPYMLTEHLEAQSFTISAFEDYHGGAAEIKTVRYDILADTAAAMMAFEAGSFDYFTTLAEVDVDRIIASGEWNVVEYEASFARSVYMNLTNGIFDNVTVRQALAYATNKENMVSLIQNGKGNVADSFFHPEMMVNTSAPDTILSYDLDKAKALLAEAGYPEGEGIPTLKLVTMETHKDYALAIQQDYAELGLEVEITFLDANTFMADMVTGNYDLAVNICNLGNMVYPWGRIFESQYLGQTNFGLINDAKIDELFAQINVTLDDETQKALIHELINYITENVIYLPLTYSANFVAFNPDLEVSVHPMSVSPYYVRWTK
ncbi:MAG: hypothetical protein IKU57_02030 [Oscillospiraceae bacterium]|nr:hypothetical protein [Oscillospiraceae bacterium]